MDLVRTDHPCFGVGCHIPHATIADDGRLCSMGQHRSGFPRVLYDALLHLDYNGDVPIYH
jgi:hypothetical protein